MLSGAGTARILADPRTTSWDFWGPGFQQWEGVELFGVSFGVAINNGHLASFQYTATAAGDVTLDLVNWGSYSPTGEILSPSLESLTIHQVAP